MRETGWNGIEIQGRIMKSLYPDTKEPPLYAKLAYERHWITLAQFLQVPMVSCEPLSDLIYTSNPMLRERAT
jgi:hypothetical protein